MTLHTLMYAAPRAGIDELFTASTQLGYLCGPEFVKQSETDEKCINETIRENINLIMPSEGWKVERLIQIARDEGVQYQPTEKCMRVRYLIFISHSTNIWKKKQDKWFLDPQERLANPFS